MVCRKHPTKIDEYWHQLKQAINYYKYAVKESAIAFPLVNNLEDAIALWILGNG